MLERKIGKDNLSFFCKMEENMELKELLKNDLVKAMKEKNKEELNTLRAVKGAIQLEVINNKKEENDSLILDVINKQIKMRNDSVNEFKKANRTDLVESYEKEIAILKRYMPEQLTTEEVENIIEGAINELNITSPKQMGLIMKEITPKIKNRYDMSKVSNIIKSKLN